MSAEQPAPFIPPSADEAPLPPAPWRVFGTRSYFRLWLAQVTSSTGDWIGLIAILAIAARVSDNSGAAVSLVMLARVVPGFFLGTIGGVLIDRFDRRRVMMTCDLARASLLLLLPFVESLGALVLISFGLEILTLLWGPAKDASVPHLVKKEQLTSANSLSLVASYATFPIASIVFSLLAALAAWLGSFDALSSLEVDQELLALVVDVCTFVVSALIVWRLPIPHDRERHAGRIDLTQTFRDIRDGLRFIATHPRVRGVIVALGVGLIGAGAMIPLGAAFAKQGLNGDSATFGVLMTALGCGAALGVVLLLVFQKRLPRETVFEFAVMGTGAALFIAAVLHVRLPVRALRRDHRRVRRHVLRHRLHRPPGDGARRAARPHVRHPLHRHPALAAALARALAAVGRGARLVRRPLRLRRRVLRRRRLLLPRRAPRALERGARHVRRRLLGPSLRAAGRTRLDGTHDATVHEFPESGAA